MKKLLKEILVPVAICAVFALVLAFTNSITAPIIAENRNASANAALLEVMPNGTGFEPMDISAYTLPKTVTEVYTEKNGGYVFKLETKGFAPGLVIMCGVNSDGTISGAKCIASGETWGKEKTFGDLTVGKNSETLADVEAGATSLTVNAYRDALADALKAAKIFGGETVDMRTPEEIFKDDLMAAGWTLDAVDLSAYTLPKTVTEAFSSANGGYVFKLTTKGFADGLVILCSINPDGTVGGAICIESNETWGKEKTFGELAVGKNSETIADVEAGATSLTVNAYRDALADALNSAKVLSGEELDLRTPEEIFNDSLTAALPASEGKFTKLFITEILDGVDAIYTADNGEGAVCIIGEATVGVDKSGAVVGEVSDELAAAAMAAVEAVNATVFEDIDITAFEGLPKQLISAKKTATGNFVIEIKGVGYGIKGGDDYHPASGEYIIIRIAIASDGTVLDCVTVSHGETPAIGGAIVEDAEYYGQYVGLNETECGEIDTVSGATLTTNGYNEAVLRAFASVKIFTGGTENE